MLRIRLKSLVTTNGKKSVLLQVFNPWPLTTPRPNFLSSRNQWRNVSQKWMIHSAFVTKMFFMIKGPSYQFSGKKRNLCFPGPRDVIWHITWCTKKFSWEVEAHNFFLSRFCPWNWLRNPRWSTLGISPVHYIFGNFIRREAPENFCLRFSLIKNFTHPPDPGGIFWKKKTRENVRTFFLSIIWSSEKSIIGFCSKKTTTFFDGSDLLKFGYFRQLNLKSFSFTQSFFV